MNASPVAGVPRGAIHCAGGERFHGGAHVAWLLMFFAILPWRLRDVVTGQALGDAADVYRIGLVVLAALLATHAVARSAGGLSRALSPPLALLFVYAAVAAVSSTFVEASLSYYSLWKATEIAVLLMVCVAICAQSPGERGGQVAYRIMVGLLAALLVMFLVEAWIVPALAFKPIKGFLPFMLQGAMPLTSANGVGFYGAVVSLSCIASLARDPSPARRVALLALLALALVALGLSQARTSIFGLALAVLVFLWFGGRSVGWLLLAVAAAVVTVSVLGEEMLLEYLRRGQDEAQLQTLTHRIVVWGKAWELFLEAPILGHGFAAAARTEILHEISVRMTSMHGAFFDVIVGVGLAGLLPWALAILLTLGRAWTLCTADPPSRSASRHAEMLALLVLVLVRAGTSSGLAMHDQTLMLFLCVAMHGFGRAPAGAGSGQRR